MGRLDSEFCAFGEQSGKGEGIELLASPFRRDAETSTRDARTRRAGSALPSHIQNVVDFHRHAARASPLKTSS